nr:unnamed protein product [Spirometra erinaceieuropaei]
MPRSHRRGLRRPSAKSKVLGDAGPPLHHLRGSDDTVNRDGLWKIKQKSGCSELFTAHNEMVARITNEEAVSEAFAAANEPSTPAQKPLSRRTSSANENSDPEAETEVNVDADDDQTGHRRINQTRGLEVDEAFSSPLSPPPPLSRRLQK